MRQWLTDLTTNEVWELRKSDLAQFQEICDSLSSKECFDLWSPKFYCDGPYNYTNPFRLALNRKRKLFEVILEKMEPAHLTKVLSSPDLNLLHVAIGSSLTFSEAEILICQMAKKLDMNQISRCMTVKFCGEGVFSHALNRSLKASTLEALVNLIPNSEELFKLLLSQEPKKGNTPLHLAIENGKIHFATILTILLKPDQLLPLLAIQNRDGLSPLNVCDAKLATDRICSKGSESQLTARILQNHVATLQLMNQPTSSSELVGRFPWFRSNVH